MKKKTEASPMAQQQPVGDASMSEPMQQPMQMGDPNMNNEMPQQDPNMGSDMDNEIMEPDAMGNEMPQDPSMENMEQPNNSGNIERDKKNIQKNIGKACADFRSYQGQDKEDLGKWIEGMLDSLDGDSSDGNVAFSDNPEDEMPMEGKYTKAELNALNEVFGQDNVEEKEPLNQKKSKPTKKSPFNNPKFN